MWQDTTALTYQEGMLFLGQDAGREIGIKTERHAITVAGAGAGKGACVIIPNLLRWPHNALVIDPKGEAAEATAEKREAIGQTVHVIDPFQTCAVDDRFRASFNPLASLDINSLTIKEDITAISDGIVKRDNPEASHWDDGAQTIISGLIAFLLLTASDDKKNLIELRAIIRNRDAFAKAIGKMENLKGCAGACEAGASAAAAKEGGYFVSNAEKNTQWLDSEAMKNGLASSSFSLSDLKNGKTTVFLVLPANYLGQHGRFLRLFVRVAIEEMARRASDGALRGAQCLFFLDEFFSLGYIDEISKAAGLMRGYGLQLWPILQDIGQLITLYGREGSETFFGNADLHQFFGNTDNLTLEYIADRLGVWSAEEVGLPPVAPRQSSGALQQMQGLSSKSETVTGRYAGVAIGAASMLGGVINSARQSAYERASALHQQGMSMVGRHRLPPDVVAKLVKRETDVVADGSICFTFGANNIFVQLAPYFRGLVKPPPSAIEKFALKHSSAIIKTFETTDKISDAFNEKWDSIKWWQWLIAALIFGFVVVKLLG